MDLENYIKTLNPGDHEKHILIFGRKYKLWRKGKYLGIGTWTKDDFIGDSFQKKEMMHGHECCMVFSADTWELVVDENQISEGESREH